MVGIAVNAIGGNERFQIDHVICQIVATCLIAVIRLSDILLLLLRIRAAPGLKNAEHRRIRANSPA